MPQDWLRRPNGWDWTGGSKRLRFNKIGQRGFMDLNKSICILIYLSSIEYNMTHLWPHKIGRHSPG